MLHELYNTFDGNMWQCEGHDLARCLVHTEGNAVTVVKMDISNPPCRASRDGGGDQADRNPGVQVDSAERRRSKVSSCEVQYQIS